MRATACKPCAVGRWSRTAGAIDSSQCEATTSNVRHDFTVQGINLADLNQSAQTSLKASVAETLAAAAGVDAQQVDVRLSSGSIKVSSTITVPHGTTVESVMAKAKADTVQETVSAVVKTTLSESGVDTSGIEVSQSTAVEKKPAVASSAFDTGYATAGAAVGTATVIALIFGAHI